MFNASEVENGPASREITCKIQKWNVNFLEAHPILVANARVDWMALQDSELTQQFEILREVMSSLVLDMARNATTKADGVAIRRVSETFRKGTLQ